MRKPILLLLAVFLVLGIAASYAKGAAATAERERIQQQCELDVNCTYYHINQ